MPASKRRRAAARAGTVPRPVATAPVEQAAAAPADPVEQRPTASRRGNGPRPARQPRPARVATPVVGADRPWGRLALLVLLALVLVVEVIIGLVTHVIYHPHRLLLVDLFFFNGVLAMPAAVVLAPVVKRLLHQHRQLRFLESLSLGAVYALLVTLVTLAFLHPAHLPANATADQLMDALGPGDVPGIVLADVLAIVVTVQLYPGLNRIVNSPRRRARERLEQRNAQPRAAGRTPGSRQRRP